MWEFFEQVGTNLKNTSILEFVAVVAGIVSVWFSRKENIWVYPTGLVNTIIYIYLCFKFELLGEATVNFYYTVMSIYGWWMWARKDNSAKPLLRITFSNKMEWVHQVIFFLGFFVSLFFVITLQRPQRLPVCGSWPGRKWKAGGGGLLPILLPYPCTMRRDWLLQVSITLYSLSWRASAYWNG
jgi:nicotinamide mononucleotide transporter